MKEISKTTPKNGSHVQSVERALLLIDILAREKQELSLTELSQQIGLPKSTTYGLLSTLRSYHYVEQSADTGKYDLGVRLFELGTLASQRWSVRDVAKPVMQELNLSLGEMVQLAAEDRGEVLYLEKIDSLRLIRIVSDVGGRLPMHCSALGKVLLAYKPESEVRWIVKNKGLPALTPKTITTLPALEKELSQIRRDGYGTDDGEIMDGLRCVAAPIRDSNDEVKYALSTSGLSGELFGEKLERTVQGVIAAADIISTKLKDQTSTIKHL